LFSLKKAPEGAFFNENKYTYFFLAGADAGAGVLAAAGLSAEAAS
jgi:hypothetical protein